MHKWLVVSKFTISTVLLLDPLFSNSAFADVGDKRADEIGSMGPVPRAQCGPSDRTESGLQGQTTSEEGASGHSELGYNCNLKLVGQFRGEGGFSQDRPSYFDHCVYMATENNRLQAHPGIHGANRNALTGFERSRSGAFGLDLSSLRACAVRGPLGVARQAPPVPAAPGSASGAS